MKKKIIKLSNLHFGRLTRRAFAAVLTLLSLPLQVIAFILMRSLRPFVLVRVGWINTPRIGHMMADMDISLLALSLENHRGRELIFWVPQQEFVCNRFLLKMIKREVNYLPRWSWLIVNKLNNSKAGSKIHDIELASDRFNKNSIDKYPAQFKFTEKEILLGQKYLTLYGLPKGAPFVCLNVRDSSYLSAEYPTNDWSYHNHRDSLIGTYLRAAEELTKRGYFVFRMGAVTREKLVTNNPMILDYSNNGMRTEFMDIYLGANCEFAISTSTGWDSVPYFFRKPLLFVNEIRMDFLSSKKTLHLMKSRISVVTHKKLTLREIFEKKVGFAYEDKDFESAGVKLEDNTSEQILNATIEMVERCQGIWLDTPESNESQQQFWATYDDCLTIEERSQFGEFRSRYVTSELLADPDWFK